METSINRVVLNWEAAYAKTFSIQVSNDAVNWTTVIMSFPELFVSGIPEITVSWKSALLELPVIPEV